MVRVHFAFRTLHFALCILLLLRHRIALDSYMDILLPLTILIPLAGIGVIWASAEGGYQPARLIALTTAVGAFMASLLLIANFPASGGEHFITEYAWLVDHTAGWD